MRDRTILLLEGGAVEQPRFSVCIPLFNGANYLIQTLESVEDQTCGAEQIELIVCDNASEDNSLDIALGFIRTSNFLHWKLLYNEQQGIGHNWNAALSFARGNYVKLLMQDDLLYRNHLSILGDVLDKHPDVDLVFSNRDIVHSTKVACADDWLRVHANLQQSCPVLIDEKKFKGSDLFKDPRFLDAPRNKIGEPSFILMRGKAIRSTGQFSEDLCQSLDYEYWYRLLKNGSGYHVKRSLGAFRRHFNQATEVNRSRSSSEGVIRDFLLLRHLIFVLSWRNRAILFVRILRNILALLKNRLAISLR